MSKHRWVRPTLGFICWVIAACLIIWLVILARTGILSILQITYVRDSARRAWQLKVIDKVYMLIAASLGIGLIAVGQTYFQKAASSAMPLRAISRVFGPELLIIALCHVATIVAGNAVGSAANRSWLMWLILGLEAAVGTASTLYGWLRTEPPIG